MRNSYGMQFIMDGSGNYYRTNEDNQLVVAATREEASIFTLFDANQRIGGGKKSTFYFAIPVEENKSVEDKAQEIKQLPEKMNCTERCYNRFDIAHFDWIDYLWQFCYMASMVGKRSEELKKELSEVDQEICDMLHLVELYELTSEEEFRTVKLLKDARQRRRDIKDEMTRLDYFQTSFGTETNITEAKNVIKQIKKLDHRVYKPRQLPELFEGMKGRETDRNAYMMPQNRKEEADNCINIIDEQKGENVMEYVRKETIYDTKTNDWIAFVREQLDFYQNIPQYMINLQIELDAIDSTIEETLVQIEDANYNVAQGYKAFKELKDLRNERKEKQRELQCLKAITEGINCVAMQEVYQNSVSAVEDIVHGNEKDETFALVSGGNCGITWRR